MQSLNYHHLRYFWVVAREGGLVKAGKVLRLSHPTLSTQIRALEDQLGDPLFSRSGRRLVLTELGKIVYRYADEIFSLGSELLDVVAGKSAGSHHALHVGIVDVVPKLVVSALLQPALAGPTPHRLVCHEDSYDKLLAELALHSLHLVIADSPVPVGGAIKAFNHLLGESDISFFATKKLAQALRPGFPESLNRAPLLLPLEQLTLRRSLNRWFDRHGLRPHIVGEFQDSALLKAFGADGMGVFPGAAVVEAEISRQYDVEVVGRADRVREQFYAISVERRLAHPAVVAITNSARRELFAPTRRQA